MSAAKYPFKTIPNNIFSAKEQTQLQLPEGTINQGLISAKLDELPVGKHVKFIYFDTFIGIPRHGHSILLTKTAPNQFLFYSFDLDEPDCEIYTRDELIEKLNNCIENNKKIVFIDNDTFMERIKNKDEIKLIKNAHNISPDDFDKCDDGNFKKMLTRLLNQNELNTLHNVGSYDDIEEIDRLKTSQANVEYVTALQGADTTLALDPGVFADGDCLDDNKGHKEDEASVEFIFK